MSGRDTLADRMGRIVVAREIECGSGASALWHVITDTERLNRAIGLGKIQLTECNDGTAARYIVKTVSGGFPLEYEERPYEWIENETFSVERVVRRGLFHRIENIFEIESKGEGCILRVTIALEPKVGLLAPIIRMQVGRFVERVLGEFQQIDQELTKGGDAGFSTKSARIDWTRLERAAGAFLEQIDPEQKEIATKLIDFVSAAPDFDVDRIRPFELADQWGVARRQLLGLCLHAVVAGLLEMSWDIVCPSCRTASQRLTSLEEIDTHGDCHLCDISFGLELDQAIEATFRPPRGLREVDEGPYCIGGPARTPHVYAQLIVPGQGHVEFPAPPQAGQYRLFGRGGAKTRIDVVPEGEAEARVVLRGDRAEPSTVRLALGGRLTVEQAEADEVHVKFERVEWTNQAATALELSTLREFRDLFASEVLKPGLTLSIARVALVFTDLTDSTKMYSVLGDARAFRVVQDHFDVLRDVVAEHDGVIVKTIGDAVMAAFTGDRRAVRAAVDMHRRLAEWRKAHEEACTVRLKVGVFAGPCYAVTANGVLDYFGQTVNVAARLQGKSAGGEIVMTERLAEEAQERDWLGGGEVTERFEAELKGVDEHIRAARVLVDGGEAWRPVAEIAKEAS